MQGVEIRPAFLVGTGPGSYRPNEWAVIMGVGCVHGGSDAKGIPSFHVVYADGEEDWVAFDKLAEGDYGIVEQVSPKEAKAQAINRTINNDDDFVKF